MITCSESCDIRQHARTTTFVNCMAWNFDQEVDMQRRGMGSAFPVPRNRTAAWSSASAPAAPASSRPQAIAGAHAHVSV
jgi:hypothetical protein